MRSERELPGSEARNKRIADTLQRSMLLTHDPNGLPGMFIETIYEAASEEALVGGDFCDVFRIGPSHTALVVGDVTGKGLQAAAFTPEVKFALRLILREDRDPARSLSRLNKYLVESQTLTPNLDGAAYVSLAVAVVNTSTGEVNAALAGAEPPLLLRGATGEVIEVSGATGSLIGISSDSDFQGVTLQMQKCDLLALTTDGLTEARTHRRIAEDGSLVGGEFFNIDGVANVLRQNASCAIPLDRVAKAIVEKARAWAGGAFRDDVCLLLARQTKSATNDS